MCSQSAISDCRSVLLYLFSSKVHVALCGLQVVYPLVESASRYDADQPMSLMTTSAQPAHQQQQYRYDNSCPSNSSSSSSVVQQPVDLSRSNTSNNSSSSRLATVSTTSRRQANQSLSTSSSKQRKPAKRSKLSVSSKRANKGQCCFNLYHSLEQCCNAKVPAQLGKWHQWCQIWC